MAGLGRKTFNSGDILLASEVQGYLQDQAVMVFAGTASRSSAIPTPSEGMVTYREDDDAVEVYDGSVWKSVAPPDTSGLVHINTTSFSAVASQSIDNVFSATYDNYKIVINAILATGTQAFNFRLRAAGSDNSTANSYLYHREGADGSTQLGDNNTAAQLFMANVTTGAQHIYTIDIRNPFAASATSFIVIGGHHQYTTTTTGYHNQTTSYDGFTVYPASSTIIGSLSVFGYRKS